MRPVEKYRDDFLHHHHECYRRNFLKGAEVHMNNQLDKLPWSKEFLAVVFLLGEFSCKYYSLF